MLTGSTFTAFSNRSIRRIRDPYANGLTDYLNMLNERDGGIGGVKLIIEECEKSGFGTDRGPPSKGLGQELTFAAPIKRPPRDKRLTVSTDASLT